MSSLYWRVVRVLIRVERRVKDVVKNVHFAEHPQMTDVTVEFLLDFENPMAPIIVKN